MVCILHRPTRNPNSKITLSPLWGPVGQFWTWLMEDHENSEGNGRATNTHNYKARENSGKFLLLLRDVEAWQIHSHIRSRWCIRRPATPRCHPNPEIAWYHDNIFGAFVRADLHGTIFAACDNGLRQVHDMIYDCRVRQKKCRCGNRKSCRRPVVSLSHASKIVPCKSALKRHN